MKRKQHMNIAIISTLMANVALLVGTITPVMAATPLMPAVPEFRTAQLGTPPEFKLATQLPKVAEIMPILAVKPFANGERYLRDVAARLNLVGESAKNGNGKLALRDYPKDIQQQTITMFEASGGFFYRYDKLLHAVPEKQAALPDDDKAFAIAVDFLTSSGLMPKDAIVNREQVSFSKPKLTEFYGETGETRREFTTSVEVRFPQFWEGHAVTGPGSKLYVALGEGGKVLGVTKMWREAAATQTYLPTIPPATALEGLLKGQGQMSVPAGCSTANVEKMDVAYWSSSPRQPQRTALPLYRVEGSCLNAKGQNLGGFEAYTAAVIGADLNLNTEKETPDLEQDVE